MELVIATFNIQNKYKIRKYSGIDKYGDHTKELLNFLQIYKVDILGVQELTKLYQERLLPLLTDQYHLVGKYRFTKLGNILPLFSKFNEATSIISKYEVIDTKTTHIPSFPSIPRIITEASIRLDSRIVKVMSTHIDVFSNKVKQKQLNYIIKKLEEEAQEFVLMGDFNSTTNNIYFNNFVKEMKKIGYKRIEANEATHKYRKLPIDHIFVPQSWKIKEIKTIDLENKMSDHKPIVIKVSV